MPLWPSGPREAPLSYLADGVRWCAGPPAPPGDSAPGWMQGMRAHPRLPRGGRLRSPGYDRRPCRSRRGTNDFRSRRPSGRQSPLAAPAMLRMGGRASGYPTLTSSKGHTMTDDAQRATNSARVRRLQRLRQRVGQRGPNSTEGPTASLPNKLRLASGRPPCRRARRTDRLHRPEHAACPGVILRVGRADGP
jgi:hypothetical protein